MPRAPYTRNIGRIGSAVVGTPPTRRLGIPLARAPAAAPREPSRLYTANARVRCPSRATSATIDCSRDKKGLTSVPVGLVAPRARAARAYGNEGARARRTPEAVIRNPNRAI